MIKRVCSFLSSSQLHLRLHDSRLHLFCHQEAARPHLPQHSTDDLDPAFFSSQPSGHRVKIRALTTLLSIHRNIYQTRMKHDGKNLGDSLLDDTVSLVCENNLNFASRLLSGFPSELRTLSVTPNPAAGTAKPPKSCLYYCSLQRRNQDHSKLPLSLFNMRTSAGV